MAPPRTAVPIGVQESLGAYVSATNHGHRSIITSPQSDPNNYEAMGMSPG